MQELTKQFIKAIQEANSIASNNYLTFLSDAVEQVENASSSDQLLADYVKQLLDIAQQKDFSTTPDKTNEFAQLLGEAHFYLLCKNKEVILERVPEGTKKTPDFKLKDNDVYFEIKTLSVVAGSLGIQQSLDDSLESHVEIEDQLNKGKRIASSVTVVQPYGKQYQKGKGTVTTVIETLIEKTRQNIKQGQYYNGDTFLVLNLSIISPFRTDNYVLRPAYCDDLMFKKAVTGELWMLAFGRPGMTILGIPEFEGKPCVESIMDKTGILVDPDYENIAGVLFMIHPWQREAETWGLYKYKSYSEWGEKNIKIIETLSAITGYNWNDDKDTNGWRLQQK